MLRQPITIALMSQHYFGSGYGRQLDDCTLEGVPLDCTYFPKGGEPYLGNLEDDAKEADATWWHAPHTCLQQVRLLSGRQHQAPAESPRLSHT